jgi:hypothetical protein
MTLGNSPQPLTRRQLRELAREHEPALAETARESSSADSAAPEPLGERSSSSAESSAQPHHSRHTSPPVPRPAADSSEAPAPLPIPEAAPLEPAMDPESGRTLTRRELRALQAASSTSSDTEHTDQVQAAPSPTRSESADAERSDAPAQIHALHPPIGHWSVDREDDSHIEAIGRRDDATFDDLVGRGVGAGGIPTTTNALILPSIPRQGPGGPITSTGEIMITGSIDLPRSLGATGQHPNLFDSSEMDRMLDQLDEGGHHNDVAPVSASRAVSTHTSTRGVMTPPRKRGASLPTVLAITAAVLAIGVLSLFVVGYAFNIY